MIKIDGTVVMTLLGRQLFALRKYEFKPNPSTAIQAGPQVLGVFGNITGPQ